MTSTLSSSFDTLARPNPTEAALAAMRYDTVTSLGMNEGASRAMDRYSAGDDAAFAHVYDFLAPRLLSSLSRRTRDRVRAEDLLQRTFMHIHRARGTFIPGSDVLRWAYAISRRLTIDELRRRSRDPIDHSAPDLDTRSSAGLAEAELAARETAVRLQRALVALPDTQREAFELVRFEGLSHEQAATVLGVTVCAVKLRAHRAYEALRNALEDRDETRPS